MLPVKDIRRVLVLRCAAPSGLVAAVSSLYQHSTEQTDEYLCSARSLIDDWPLIQRDVVRVDHRLTVEVLLRPGTGIQRAKPDRCLVKSVSPG
jgi:formyltetrahydrofolate hydrolase